jgi:hypothetical protein
VTNSVAPLEEVPPLEAGGTSNTPAYGITPTDRLSTLSYLARNGLSVPSNSGGTGAPQQETGSASQTMPTNRLPTPPSPSLAPNLSLQASSQGVDRGHAGGSSQPPNPHIPKPSHPNVLSPPPDPPAQDSSQHNLLPPPLKPLGRPPNTPSVIPAEFVSTFGVYMPPPTPSNEGSEEADIAGGEHPQASIKNVKGKEKATEANASPSLNSGAASPYGAAAASASPLRRQNSSSLSFISGGGVPAMTYDAFWSSHGAVGRTVNVGVPTTTTTAPTMVANGSATAVGTAMQSS